ncbi:MAG: DNA repair protein RadA [Chloroflexi bacterium CG15_BIG_FIL_POST_REV_8_21_14_020_46_15]|nr:MAG: DNA repair protein RadA [Dehalococcoidia bacterium CG2_30_46_19]PIW40320.1 MAG: DNA repair protein RadA [Chloroflexi bacterium CG15_BIG_FIL_POST_REV_8_21_14_020_46_15]
MKSSNHGKLKFKTLFVCQQCGKESPKWLGRCPECGTWNSLVETTVSSSHLSYSRTALKRNKPQELSKVEKSTLSRLSLGFSEINRVLGGGLVPGSVVLIAGEPGVGKSTLLLQASAMIAKDKQPVGYISGEESINQVKLRAERLNINGEGLLFLSEADIAIIIEHLEEISPKLVVIDSIQTMYLEDISGMPGSVSQVRECTSRIMRWAKENDVPVLLAGHVTKDGSIAGPGTLEHIVDVVLYFEGEPFSSYRVLRGIKNRFGSTNEVGLFEMGNSGLVEVDNPSQALLSRHTDATTGSVVVSTLEGSRPLLVELQALTTTTSFTLPRRIANGVDFNRLLLIIAVLTKRAGLRLFNQDVIVNVTGGLRLSEPAIDLGIALAIASSFSDRVPIPRSAVFGEIGLNGEIRTVPQVERRIAEAARLGLKTCLIPKLPQKPVLNHVDIQLLEANSLGEALRLGLTRKTKREIIGGE